ncbi:hypothetical protein [Thalassomonas haliotis]|uniref:Bacteriocin n=1 Tax=Thalassomonas haliotis TaxID=485448 RepID=A0ABY7V6N2_9GAMM|nr:hypothetical protein [Thalassomonas haliotis]WDE09358.1 hypothetical protein H3N35_13525 [Thalassomonas haliotis]
MTEDNASSINKNSNTEAEIAENELSELEESILSETSGGTGGGSEPHNPNIGCGD